MSFNSLSKPARAGGEEEDDEEEVEEKEHAEGCAEEQKMELWESR